MKTLRTKRTLAFTILLALPMATVAAPATVTLTVQGWTCGGCAAATKIALKKLEGVEEVRTDLENAEAVVSYDDAKVAPEKMIRAIQKLGYKAAVKGTASSKAASARAGGKACAAESAEEVSILSEASITAQASASVTVASAASAPRRSVSPERVEVFETPLGCCAVEGLGCGSLAKPVLAELDRDARIAEAWMNRSGTLVAVIWKEATVAKSGVGAVEEIFDARGLEAKALAGPAREKALADFLGGSKWYRGAEVNHLSEEEARVIANRLVRRIEKDAALSPEQAASLRRILAEVFTRHFVGTGPLNTKKMRAELLEVASRSLPAGEIRQFEVTLSQGIGAVPEETD